MVVKWAEEFQKAHPKIRIDVAAGGAGKGMADALAKVADLGMVSRQIYPAEIEKGAWFVTVTKDGVVATINQNNPIVEKITTKGLTRQALARTWISGDVKTWGEAIGEKDKQPMHLYTRSDACGAAETWAKFLGDKKQEDLSGIGVYGDPGLATAVSQDAVGIGYNNINYAYDTNTKKQITGIRVLPIDFNENGKIDKDEDFYNTRDEIVAAINAGKYPSPPARDLYLVSQGRPDKKIVIEFLGWILTDGQKYVPEAGYINLSQERLSKELGKL
jgi:phosphate transport system substrate-binding protein